MRLLIPLLIFCFLSNSGYAFDPATQDDSQALVRHFKKPVKPLPPFKDGEFEPLQGETITLMGGTDMYRMQEYGYLEAMFHLAFPEKKLKFRNIAWPADTVYRQQRPMYFYTEKGDTKEGSIPDQREKIEPGIFILQFGKMESLEGRDAIPGFVASYRNLIIGLSPFGSRIVLLAPSPFFESGPASDLARDRNKVLTEYSMAVRKLAEENKLLFAKNGFSGEKKESLDKGFPTQQPVQAEVESLDNAMWLMSGLNLASKLPAPNPRIPGRTDKLQNLIVQKNKLWAQYYRPTNWAFLFGDRQNVPSSRDHRDANRRWFVEELEMLPPLIDQADQAIWTEVNKVVK